MSSLDWRSSRIFVPPSRRPRRRQGIGDGPDGNRSRVTGQVANLEVSTMDGMIRDRIQEFRRVPARELLDNDGNPRRHPQAQRDALRGVLEQVGIADALVAYYSERKGGQLVLIDGHLRKQDF